MRVSVSPTWRWIAVAVVVSIPLLYLVRLFLILIGQAIFSGVIPDEISDPGRYASIRAQSGPDSLIAHFPKSIPVDANDVVFSAFPGFLQGGGWVTLRFTIDPAAAAPLVADARRHAVYESRVASIGENPAIKPMHQSLLEGMDRDQPGDHDVIITYVPPQQDKSGWWNHGERAGLTYDPVTAEMSYWAEWW